MPTPEQIQEAIRSVSDPRSFIDVLLRETLGWPINLDFENIGDITYEWTDEELNTIGLSRDILSGPVLQMQSLEQEHEQRWGIFILEFANIAPLVTGRGLTGPLRNVLRGLVPKRRGQPNRRAWARENLLFICTTHQYQHFRFAYFKAPHEGHAEPLTTFGWGPDIPCRTACEFNLPALCWPEDPSDSVGWLRQWSVAFNKEPLTRKFFKRFDKSLEAIKTDLEQLQKLPSAEAYSRAQVLLERLLFLYFLQNRGWLNRERHCLVEKFRPHRDRPEECTYYVEFLEKLFWTLATAPGSPARLDGIPFLNGGLFDDDEFIGVIKPNRGKENPPLRVRNATFAFVFEHLLEAFNFTVREDTPLNQDVAVDPEMLGKVFESIVLHAEAEAEYNAPDKRKATGSYYTPRIVVHFICREALRQYLLGHLIGVDWAAKIKNLFDIDDSDGLNADEITQLKAVFKAADGRRLLDILKPIKMCDPAVGSGAFPVGLLHELVNLRRIAETIANGFVDPARREGRNWIHETKADIVANCLYGVDIQQQAIEICRLRLWLSLIVDYDLGLDPFEADPVQFSEAIGNISQLPNLEMNFRRGDSLLDHICGVNVRVAPENSKAYKKEYEKIKDLGRKLHLAKKSDRKRELRIDILRCHLDLSERVLNDEIKALKTQDSLAATWFGETTSETEKRRQIAAEISQLQAALQKVAADRKALEKIAARPYDASFYPELRKLEGADFDSPCNFSWRIDYADIFQNGADIAAANGKTQTALPGGFDLILGNPPFVTARNPEKRELYRQRWKRVCEGQYLLICPFFDLSFGLLRPGGHLGFIVSNAFAKREFGKPLIEEFFPTVDLQKIVDCSGLMFPGHGTPTCIIFGASHPVKQKESVTVTALLPGGGDLRTPPEDSSLWMTISERHDCPGYEDSKIAVYAWDKSRLLHWPMNFDLGADNLRLKIEASDGNVLGDFLDGSIGRVCFTGADDLFFVGEDFLRRIGVENKAIARFAAGDLFRNWTHIETHCLSPYDQNGKLLGEADADPIKNYLHPWKSFLTNRLSYGQTQLERGLAWWEYSLIFPERIRGEMALCICEIGTHVHVEVVRKPFIANRANPVFELQSNCSETEYHLIEALLNSSTTLFWLKQVCYNKGAGEDEERDRFEYAGGKVQQLPIPNTIADPLRGKRSELTDRLQALSQACWERGRQMPALAMKKLFEKPGEAYHDWNASLPGYITPDTRLGLPFQTLDDLQAALSKASNIREELRGEMIALQEEMDWLVYAAYGLLPVDSPVLDRAKMPASLSREQRPFGLWAQAGGDFDKAMGLIPTEWSDERKKRWRVRLEVIRDNEHIRRIEQPVYKRRWDEQWKVGNGWQCGPVAYDAEFVDAFEWWLSEKVEWWLEKKAGGGPVELEKWSAAVWQDTRVQAAWGVVRETLERLERRVAFSRYFTTLVKEQSVPDNIPAAVPWEKIETKVPASVKRIRGKLNVPREPFRITTDGHYVWAGMK